MIIIDSIILQWFVLGRTYILTRGMLVLVGLLQPLVPVFYQIFTLKLLKCLCHCQNYPDHCELIIIAYIILGEYVLGRTYVLTRGMLFLVGLLQPLVVPIFDQIFTTKTIERPL
jgi:hypothetical protein